jgi:hypothetical protein
LNALLETNNSQLQDNNDSNQHKPYVTQYGRTIKRPDTYKDYVSYQVYQAPSTFEPTVEYINPIVLMSSSDPETM